MIAAVDSSGFHPTLAQVQAAYAQGIRVWGKYLPGPGIYSGDTKADYDTLKAGGMRTIAFCSGWADPAQQKALGASWGVDHICLDVENGIRGDGSWVQGWLSTSGAGLYGSQSVSWGRTAPFFIMAAYPGYNPNATWSGQAPSVPHGWQWAGSVSAFGGAVDRSWLDDWFGGTTPAPQPTHGEQMAYYMTPTTHAANEPLLWLCDDLQLGPKRAVWNPAEQTAYTVNMQDQKVYTVPRFVFDAMPLADANASGFVAIKAAVDALTAKVATISTGTQGPAGPPGPAVTSVTISGTFPVTP